MKEIGKEKVPVAEEAAKISEQKHCSIVKRQM
jgi:hypothetical protein